MKYFVSWSGGKDSTLALWRAKEAGKEVSLLLTTLSRAEGRTMGHGFLPEVVRAQGEALGLEVLFVPTSWEEYEADFKAALASLRAQGVRGGVFGDIDLPEHRAWVERVCKDAGVEPLLPLWGFPQEELLREWAAQGFEGIVVSARADFPGLSWLGRELKGEAVAELASLLAARGLSPSGEAGEYHTLAVWGPPFRKRLKVREAVPVFRGGSWVLEIRRFSLEG